MEQIRAAPEVLTIVRRPFWIFCENMRFNGAESFSAATYLWTYQLHLQAAIVPSEPVTVRSHRKTLHPLAHKDRHSPL